MFGQFRLQNLLIKCKIWSLQKVIKVAGDDHKNWMQAIQLMHLHQKHVNLC